MDFGAEIKFGGPASSLYANSKRGIEQETMIGIARLSNFNVVLQSRHLVSGGMDCRAYCKSCQEILQIDFDKITMLKVPDDIWIQLGIFCDQHKHDGAQVKEQRPGRLIRDEA
jgi:hypothetical protein